MDSNYSYVYGIKFNIGDFLGIIKKKYRIDDCEKALELLNENFDISGNSDLNAMNKALSDLVVKGKSKGKDKVKSITIYNGELKGYYPHDAKYFILCFERFVIDDPWLFDITDLEIKSTKEENDTLDAIIKSFNLDSKEYPKRFYITERYR